MRLPQGNTYEKAFYASVAQGIAAGSFVDECFVLAQAQGGTYNLWAKEIVDLTLLAYKILRKKTFYFDARGRLLKQLFKVIFEQLVRKKVPVSSMGWGIVLWSDESWWVGATGDIFVYKVRKGTVNNILQDSTYTVKLPSTYVRQLNGLYGNMGGLENEEAFIVCTKSIPRSLNEKRLKNLISDANSDFTRLPEMLIELARKRRRIEAAGVLVIQR